MDVIIKTDVLNYSKELLTNIIVGMGLEVNIETKKKKIII